MAYRWRSEDNYAELVPSIHLFMGPEDQAQTPGLPGKHLYTRNHHVTPGFLF